MYEWVLFKLQTSIISIQFVKKYGGFAINMNGYNILLLYRLRKKLGNML